MKTNTQTTLMLTIQELADLKGILNGADIQDPAEAKRLRDLDAKLPGLMTITKPMGNYGVRDKLPWFGAITTAEGKKAIKAAQKLQRQAPARTLISTQTTPMRCGSCNHLMSDHECPINPKEGQDLVGLAEVADMLEMTRQAATMKIQRAKNAPDPLARLRMGPIWSRATVKAWMRDGAK